MLFSERYVTFSQRKDCYQVVKEFRIKGQGPIHTRKKVFHLINKFSVVTNTWQILAEAEISSDATPTKFFAGIYWADQVLAEFDCFEIFNADVTEEKKIFLRQNLSFDFVVTILLLPVSADRPNL